MAVPVIVVHGGAEPFLAFPLSLERSEQGHSALHRALVAGYSVLHSSGLALDAVTEAVKVLEDEPLFNSGRGASFNEEGAHEMDSSVMDGRDRKAGAVAGICGPRHPVLAARAVMERTRHVMLAGQGANDFCAGQGLEMCESTWFDTELRREELTQALAAHSKADRGTVGAVALDSFGNLAAATSTGGQAAKLPGRVGDSPIIGAGTWAVNGTCAVSCTGHGEYFIRYGAAHEVYGRMKWGNQSLEVAANSVVNETLQEAGGEGGLIAVDTSGAVALPFNCPGMFRGYVQAGETHTAIWKDWRITPLP